MRVVLISASLLLILGLSGCTGEAPPEPAKPVDGAIVRTVDDARATVKKAGEDAQKAVDASKDKIDQALDSQ